MLLVTRTTVRLLYMLKSGRLCLTVFTKTAKCVAADIILMLVLHRHVDNRHVI